MVTDNGIRTHNLYLVDHSRSFSVILPSCGPNIPTLASTPDRDAAFISKGYDPTTHFETTVEDVLDMYKRITGKELDLTAKDPSNVEAQN